MKLPLWLVASTAVALGGCDFAPRYAPPHMALPAKFNGAPPGGVELPANGAWWRSFKDRTLDDLQAQVDVANPDLAAAIAASDAAFARAAQVEAGLLPQADAISQVTANKQSANRPLRSKDQPNYYGNNILGGQVSYEIDIWGRVRDLAKAANLTAEASADALAQARLELHAELARAYIDLRGLDAQAKLLSDTIGIYRQALELTKSRLAAQIASPVDVDRAQNQLSSAEAQATEVALQRATLETAIAALVGKPAASFSVARSPSSIPLPKRPRAVPADVLRRRPDVAEQERLTAAASQTIGAARANFFPRFTLLALGGTQDTALRLLDPENIFWTIGPAVDFPLFDAGLRQAELEVAQDQFTQAAEQYRSVVLRAIKEVADNLSGLRLLAQEYTQASTSARAAQDAANLSLTLYRDGAASFLDVVTAQQAALEAQRLTIILHTRQLENVIGLMLALGGGWTVPPPQPLQPINTTPTPVQLVKDLSKARP
ncbi:MAG TPA: efflux transporter outer membrane subunit [Roseiarcus sp.]|jgi:NodT family efflux transporter outer membrane factor (OMF) lipoprotein|nr:efflux transporter outer membrane subunit [Roseiarcus sp.]